MTENAERVKEEVLQLSDADRAELARFLIESLDESDEPNVVEAAWGEELRIRVERIEQKNSVSGPRIRYWLRDKRQIET